MRYHSKPQESNSITRSIEAFNEYLSDKKEEGEFQYNVELVCSPEEVQSFGLKSFALMATGEEGAISSSWSLSSNAERNRVLLSTSVGINEPKTLCFQFPGTKSTALEFENVSPVKQGSISVSESFIPVKLSVQIGERLGWPTQGYFYHFIDDELAHEYQILDGGKWTFSASTPTSEQLSDEVVDGHEVSVIVLPYKVANTKVSRQHLLYVRNKLSAEFMQSTLSAEWLDENACVVDLDEVIETRTANLIEKPKQIGEEVVYTVQAGDSLSAIAHRQGLSLDDLLTLNPQHEENPHQINVGDKLVLERNSKAAQEIEFHTCQLDPKTNQREAWDDIAALYNLLPRFLLELNPLYLDDPLKLKVGDKLVVTPSEKTAEVCPRQPLPPENITTDKTVFAYANVQCSQAESTPESSHAFVEPITDRVDADKRTPVIKVEQIFLHSQLLSSVDELEA